VTRVDPLLLVLALLVIALVFWRLSGWLRASSGLPAGDVISSDTRAWGRVDAPLTSRRLGLTGRPDYLVREQGGLVPVEVKSGAAPPKGAHAAHVYQLAAYCALVTEAYGQRPAYGLIQYRDRLLRVPYTPLLEQELTALLAQMRAGLTEDEVDRSHSSPSRCRGCGLREDCDQALL
jgi:CRISPR-associated exonuclease Cas4